MYLALNDLLLLICYKTKPKLLIIRKCENIIDNYINSAYIIGNNKE